ncbi:MAG TPA: amidohydrolase family protein, partial [Actinomycetota bacterium]
THADQLGASGAAEAAAQVGAVSADHLNHISEEGIAALRSAETIGVLLPVSTLFLRAEPPPVSRLVEAGVALAIATDFNPGTSPCLSMPQVIQTAGSLYGLSTTAAISAATVNAACVLSREKEFGSLQPGLRANFVITDDPDPAMIAYRPGHNPVVETWIEGERFFARD